MGSENSPENFNLPPNIRPQILRPVVHLARLKLGTRFEYRGDGHRVTVEVEGEAPTTYLLDYAGGGRIPAESTGDATVWYLYGQDCLGELRDGQWRYYLLDGNGQVRQGSNTNGGITEAWRFDPQGTVLEGNQGPVSHLVCGGVYDRSTGLLYKGGRYFDPNPRIWLVLLPIMVFQVGWGKKRRKE